MIAQLNNLILFDIDRTLFDTDVFIKEINKHLAQLAGVDIQVLFDLGNRYFYSLGSRIQFDLHHYCEYLGNKLGVPSFALLQEFTHNKTLYEQSLFLDVMPTIESLVKKKISLGIFSEGNLNFQKMKIDYSGLASIIDAKYVYLFDKKLDPRSIEKIPKNAVIVDDKKEVVDELMKKGYRCIWINRQSDSILSSYPTISTLTEMNILFDN